MEADVVALTQALRVLQFQNDSIDGHAKEAALKPRLLAFFGSGKHGVAVAY